MLLTSHKRALGLSTSCLGICRPLCSSGSYDAVTLYLGVYSEYSVTDSDRIGPVQIGEVTGPDPVHLRPDRLITTFRYLEPCSRDSRV